MTATTRGPAALTALLFIAATLGTARAGEPAAEPDEAAARFQRGAQQYNLGHFREAIVEFEAAYEREQSPILLFNIAQCHFKLGNKERALFLYRRYLEQAPRAPNHADVSKRIADLEQAIARERAAPPQASASTSPGAPRAPTPAELARAAAARERRPWTVGVHVAPALIWFTGKDLTSPVVFAAGAEGTYALVLRDALLRIGLEGLVTTVPFTNPVNNAQGTSALWGFLARARYLRRPRPDLVIGGGLGAGVMWWTGLVEGNPFTVARAASSGPVPLPTFEIAVHAEHALTSRWLLALAPALIISKTTSAGLSDATSAVLRLELALRLAYAF
jgi:Tetratricopeptide repeat